MSMGVEKSFTSVVHVARHKLTLFCSLCRGRNYSWKAKMQSDQTLICRILSRLATDLIMNFYPIVKTK